MFFSSRGASLDNNSYSSTPRLQKHVLDTVIQLPLMTHLSLMPAYPESQRHNRCGTGRRRHRHRSKDEIEKNVKRYRPLPSCQYLIEVRVGDTTFEGIRAANGRLRYVAVWEFENLSVRFLYYTCKYLYRTSTQIAGKHPATSTFPSQIFSKFPLPKVRVLGADVTSSLAGVDKSSFFLDLAIDDCWKLERCLTRVEIHSLCWNFQQD